MSDLAFSSEVMPAYFSATVCLPPLLPVPWPLPLLPCVLPVCMGPKLLLSVPAAELAWAGDCLSLGPWLWLSWLLLGRTPNGMEPTGVSTPTPEEPVAAAARICRMLLLLLPPVLWTLCFVPRIPSISGVSAGMARKLRMVELEE